MDWMRTMAWVFRGRGWLLAGLVGLVGLVYAHVPLTMADPPTRDGADQASARSARPA